MRVLILALALCATTVTEAQPQSSSAPGIGTYGAGSAIAPLNPLTADLNANRYSITGIDNLTARTASASVNQVINVTAIPYSASRSLSTLSCTARSGSKALRRCRVSAGLNDFIAGQAVVAYHAGVASALAAPSPRATAYNIGGTTNWSYQVIAVDAKGGTGPSSKKVSVTNTARLGVECFGDAVAFNQRKCNGLAQISPYLQTKGLNKLTWAPVTNAVGYLILGCSGASCTPTLIGILPQMTENPMPFYDLGMNFGYADSTRGNSSALASMADTLYTTIAAAGTTPTLAAAPSISGSVTLAHDDGPAFNAAIQSFCPGGPGNRLSAGRKIYMPAGVYPIATQIVEAKCSGPSLAGAGYDQNANTGAAPTWLQWNGPPGMPMIVLNQTQHAIVERFSMHPGRNTPGACVDTDEFPVAGDSTVLFISTHASFRNLSCGDSAFGFWFSDRNTVGDNENMVFSNVLVAGGNGDGAGIASMAITGTGGAPGEAKDFQFVKTEFASRPFGIYMPLGGSFNGYNMFFINPGGIDVYAPYPDDTISIDRADSEVGGRFLVSSSSRASFPIKLSNIRFSGASAHIAGDQRVIMYGNAGPLTVLTSAICTQVANDACTLFVDNYAHPAALFSIGNTYGNTNPFAAQHPNRIAITSLNDLSVAPSTGVPTPMAPQIAGAITAGSLIANLNGGNSCAGTVALTSGSPSTATASNACITTSCRPSCTDETSASAIRCVPGAGSLALTGPNTVTDTVAWACQ